MKKYFDINLEFDHNKLETKVKEIAFNGKGYCCFVDLTSLVYSFNNDDFKKILNSSVFNSCDGSYIAIYSSRIYNEQNKAYIGPDFFKKFISNKGKHLILGNTEIVFNKIKNIVEQDSHLDNELYYLDVPFKKIDEFNYQEIAKKINKIKPNYIWVSLGAPKQEYFMYNLEPHIDSGIMLGVGAALNYYSREIKPIPNWTKKLKVVWIYRLITEPKKQIKRLKTIFIIFPKMIKIEKQKVKKQ